MNETTERTIQDVGRMYMRMRRTMGLSREQAAERSGLHKNTIERIEHGKSELKLSTLIQACNGLNIPVSRLFEQKNNATSVVLDKSTLSDNLLAIQMNLNKLKEAMTRQ